MARGTLRIYLGAAPGVGKTYAMLNEGRRRLERGTDVVVAVVETHGRAQTEAQLEGIERVPLRTVEHRGTTLTDLDLEAVLARRPEVALVDELAHTNAPGGPHEKRWQDIDALLEAGIEVISTVNVQHLEGLNDVVEGITGIRQRETVPDAWVRSADQIELVDMTPEAIRRRMAHGNIYPAERIDAALGNYFRSGNLSALRELALLWVADRVDEALTEYRARHGISAPWETRERVVVALTGAPGGDHLVRRAARMATRSQSDLVGVHVRLTDGVRSPGDALLDEHRVLLAQLGGRYVEVAGSDVATALLAAARAEGATQLVVGASRRSSLAHLASGSVINRVLRGSGPIDVHVISTPEPGRHGRRRIGALARRGLLPARRRAIGWVLAVVAPLVLAGALTPQRDGVELSSILLLYLLVVVGVAAVGGAGPAVLTAVGSSLCANWFFFPPLHTWTVADGDNVVALSVFIAVGLVVSSFVGAVARRSAEANRARAEAETLARLAAAGGTADPLATLVEHLRDTFGLRSVSVLARAGAGWTVEGEAGDEPPREPEQASDTIPIGDDLVLALRGPAVAAEDRHVVRAFATQLGAAIDSRHLTAQAQEADRLGKVDELRNALLAAVSHDLRTPLASIKASASSLLEADVEWPPEAIESFATAIVEETDRLTVLVENLLDMSRLTSGTLAVRSVALGVEEIVPAALASLGDRARHQPIDVDVPETLPRVATDPALVERAVANLVDNALAWSEGCAPVRVEAGAVGLTIHIRVVDRGPGIPVGQREAVFQPFQRLGDRSNGAGVGLGLAVARGFVEAVGGELVVEDTPGGGTTMVVALPTVMAGGDGEPA